MKIRRWLWVLWGAMALSMLLKWKIDTYMIVGLIILPILIVLLELQEELAMLKEEAKYQRKFAMDRFSVLSDKIKDLSSQFEKKLVVDFAEFAKSNSTVVSEPSHKSKSKRKKAVKLPSSDAEAGIEADNNEEIDFGETASSGTHSAEIRQQKNGNDKN